MRTMHCILLLVALYLRSSQSSSWDIVVGTDKRLEFYYNRTLTHTEDIPSAKDIQSPIYDPVHYRVIFADIKYQNVSIYSFDLSTRQIQHLVTGSKTSDSMSLAYDPVTQLLFWRTDYSNICSFPLNPASSNIAVTRKHIITANSWCLDIAVDSCGGFIYWITNLEIERARFDGSEREILIEKYSEWRYSLAIDPQSQKMYWIELYNDQLSIESANLNGKNGTTLYVTKNEENAKSLAVSNDFIYWRGDDQKAIWQLPKNPQQREEANKLFSISHSSSCFDCQYIAANYTTKEQTQGNLNCERLKSLIPNHTAPHPTDVSVLCFHGTQVSGETRCECTQGYTGERCEVLICQNYCVQGYFSISADGQPKCRCKTAFSGERCEVNVCHKHCLNRGVCSKNEEDGPVCECIEGYNGERCEVSICKDYCLQGNCSVSTEGKPKCSCNASYSGERCEFNACHAYCLNNGACSLNQADEPICECPEGYDGERCDVPAVIMKCIQFVSMLRDMLSPAATPVTLGKEELMCASTVV